MRLRMLSYPDLFAYDAKYLRFCYGHYISERSIRAAVEKADSMQVQTVYEKCFNKLCTEIDKTVFSKRKFDVLLSDLHSRFLEILEQSADDNVDVQGFTSWKLKQKLKKRFGTKLCSFLSVENLILCVVIV